MPLLVIPYPQFDPVLVHLGPLDIRWYALAYITGILGGWVYARAIIKRPRLWGGTAPLTVLDFDDFILWVTFGIIVGGRLGNVLFYDPSYYAANPLEIVMLWHGGMAFHGGFLGCVHRGHPVRAPSPHSDSVARRLDLRGGADRPVPRPHRQFHQ